MVLAFLIISFNSDLPGRVSHILSYVEGGSADDINNSPPGPSDSSNILSLAPSALASSTSHPFLLFNDIQDTPGFQYQTQSPWKGWQSSVISAANKAKSKDFTRSWSGDEDWVSQRGNYAMNLALAYQITNDPSYATKAKEALLNLDVGTIPASPPMMRPEAFQDMSLLSYSLAYDWVQPTLDASTDMAIRDKLATLADTCYKKLNFDGTDLNYVSFVDWQGQAYPIMGIAGVVLNDYTNPNGLSLSSDAAEWRRVGTDYLFVNDKLHDYNKPLIAFEDDNQGVDTMGSYKAYYIEDMCWWAQIYTRFYGKNFFDVYPIAEKILTAEVWESLPNRYSSDYDTEGQMKFDYQRGIANLLDSANLSYALNHDDTIDASNILPYSQVCTHIYDTSQLPDALPYLVYGDYSSVTRTNPPWTNHLYYDSVYQVFRGNWNKDSDWLSLVTFNRSTTVYSRRNTWHGDQMSFEYYSRGDLLLSDGGEDKYVLDQYWGQSEISHNTIAVENPRTPFATSSWADSPARGILKGAQYSNDVSYHMITPANIEGITQVPWMSLMDVNATISTVVGNSFGKRQSLSSPIQYDRSILYPDNDYFIVIDRLEGTQTWGYRSIFRPSSLTITPTKGDNIGHVEGNLVIGSTPYNWQSLDYKTETSTGISTNSIVWGTTNPYGNNVKLQLYTVPSSPVLVTKYVTRIAGYGASSEVYSPVLQFRSDPANDLYRVTVLLSSYSSEAGKVASTVEVTGTGNALKVTASNYTDYVYTGDGKSAFGPFSTDADTVFVRVASQPAELTMINGSFINYMNSTLVYSTDELEYLTLKQNKINTTIQTTSDRPANFTLHMAGLSSNDHVELDGNDFADWSYSSDNAELTIVLPLGQHEFNIIDQSQAPYISTNSFCGMPLLAFILAISVFILAPIVRFKF